jgi:hypothetical protein
MEDDSQERILLRVLSRFDFESAHLETIDYFRALAKSKSKGAAVDTHSDAFNARERSALLFRALRDGNATDSPIAATTDELDSLPPEMLNYLWVEWQTAQSDQFAAPSSDEEVDRLIEELKKNIPSAPLAGLPLTGLLRLTRTLASRYFDLLNASSGASG